MSPDTILPFHLLSLAFVAWNVLQADHMGFRWMKGKEALLDANKIRKYHIRVSIGLGLMITTGLLMFWPLREYLLSLPQFYVKIGFVVALLVNSFVVNKFSRIPVTRTYASLTSKERFPLLLTGAVSTLCWLGAALGGLYLFQS